MNHPWLLAAGCLVSLAALAMLIRAVLGTLRDARICAVPLVPRQDVEFPAAGRAILCIEGPRLTPRFRRLSFELRLPGGASVAWHRIIFRTVTSGFSKARVTLGSYELPFAGRYLLEINGLEPRDLRVPGHQVVFMRRHLARSLLLVIGMTVMAAAAITSLVFLLLAVMPTAAAIDPGRATGYLEMDGTRIEMREAFAQLNPNEDGRLAFTPELRIVVADREVPQDSLAGSESLPVLELARAGKVLGLLIRLDPGNPGSLLITPLLPPRAGNSGLVTLRHAEAGDGAIKKLQVSAQRVGGDLVCPAEVGIRCSIQFSAPLFSE